LVSGSKAESPHTDDVSIITPFPSASEHAPEHHVFSVGLVRLNVGCTHYNLSWHPDEQPSY